METKYTSKTRDIIADEIDKMIQESNHKVWQENTVHWL